MDVMTLDSPKDNFTLPNSDHQLEIPNQERLLPIGQSVREQAVEKVKLQSKVAKINEHIPAKRLIKQLALESPTGQFDIDETIKHKTANIVNKRECPGQQKMKKVGPFSIGPLSSSNPGRLGSWYNPQILLNLEASDMKHSLMRTGDECVSERCSECGTIKEEYSDEEIGLCIVTLGTFIHREPTLAAPLLPEILNVVAKISTNAMYPWQTEGNIHLPGGAVSVAHQFLRCVLHQFAPNGIFVQIFQTHTTEQNRSQFFKSMVQALSDFNELNPLAPLQLLLEALNSNSKKTLPTDNLMTIFQNMACYLDCLSLESNISATSILWSNVLPQLENLFRRILLVISGLEDVTSLLKIMMAVLKIPTISQHKGILEPFSKIFSYAIQFHFLNYSNVVELCYLCNRGFVKERDKLVLSRMVVYELVQALKFKTCLPDTNLLILINIILQDTGGSLPSNVVVRDIIPNQESGPIYSTNVSECMRINLGDVVDFLTDFHTLTKMKSYCKGIRIGLNDDTLGGILKGSIAQYLALEIAKGNGRDNRAVAKYFPWLYNSSSMQQTSREFVECIGHIRLLSWVLLGSLTHIALHGINAVHNTYQTIPQEASCQIADQIQVIMNCFAEQPKASVLHMSSLFHAFILCQLWTVYLEQSLNNLLPTSEPYNTTMNILFDFWGKITPCILQLVQQSKMLCEIVSLHFLSMLEALLECDSTFVGKLLPLWTPVLSSNNVQLPGHLQVRLQNCRNFPPNIYKDVPTETHLFNPVLLKWLQRLQFKMGQIELQSSTATQFYSL